MATTEFSLESELEQLTQRPQQTAEHIHRVVKLLETATTNRQGTGDLVYGFGETTPRKRQRTALTALEELADSGRHDSALGTREVLQRLHSTARKATDGDTFHRTLSLLTAASLHAPTDPVDQIVVPYLTALVEEVPAVDRRVAAITALGYIRTTHPLPTVADELHAVWDTEPSTDPVQMATVIAAGRALTGPEPDSERYETLLTRAWEMIQNSENETSALDPPEEIPADSLAAGLALAGSLASGAGDDHSSAQAIGERILDDLSTASDPALQTAVPAGIGYDLASPPVTRTDWKCDYLQTAINTDTTATQHALWAIKTGLEAGVRPAQPLVELLETVTIDAQTDPAVQTAFANACSALNTYDPADTDDFDVDLDRVQEDVSRIAIAGSSPSARQAADAFSIDFGTNVDTRESDTEAEGSDERDTPLTAELKERLETKAQQRVRRGISADRLTTEFEHADDWTDRALTIQTATEYLNLNRTQLQHQLAYFEDVPTLFSLLLEGLDDQIELIRETALEGLSDALQAGHITWETAQQPFTQAATKSQHLQLTLLTELAQIIAEPAVNIGWNPSELAEFIHTTIRQAADNDVPDVGVLAWVALFNHTQLNWQDACSYLDIEQRPQRLTPAYIAIVTGAAKANTLPNDVRNYLLKQEYTRDPDILWLTFARGLLTTDNATWDTIADQFHGYQNNGAKTATAAIDTALTLIVSEIVEWEDISTFLRTARTEEPEAVAKEAVRAANVGLQEGNVEWEDVSAFLRTARTEEPEAVAKEAVRAARAGLQEGNVEWEDVSGFLQTSRTDGTKAVAQEAIRAAGVGLQEGNVEWEDVSAFLRTSRTEEPEAVAKVAVTAGRVGLQAGNVEWEDVSGFLQTAWTDGTKAVAKEAVTAVRDGLHQGTVEWGDISTFLRTARTEEPEAVAKEAVTAARAGLHHGTVEWEDVSGFLYTSRTDGTKAVAKEAVRAVGAGLQEGNVEWEDISAFLRTARTEEPEAVAKETITAARAGLQEGRLKLDQVRSHLSDQLSGEQATPDMVLQSVLAGLSEGTLRVGAIERFLSDNIEQISVDLSVSSSIILYQIVERALKQHRAVVGQFESVIDVLITAEEPGVRERTLELVTERAQIDEVEDSLAKSLVERGVDDTAAVAQQALELSRVLYDRGICSESWFRSTVMGCIGDAERPASVRATALQILGETAPELDIDDAVVTQVHDAASGTAPVQVAAADCVPALYTATEQDRESIMSLLEPQLSPETPAVCQAATESLLDCYTTSDSADQFRSVSPINRERIDAALKTATIDLDSRLKLLELRRAYPTTPTQFV